MNNHLKEVLVTYPGATTWEKKLATLESIRSGKPIWREVRVDPPREMEGWYHGLTITGYAIVEDRRGNVHVVSTKIVQIKRFEKH